MDQIKINTDFTNMNLIMSNNFLIICEITRDEEESFDEIVMKELKETMSYGA